MARNGGRYPGHNLSNPFAHLAGGPMNPQPQMQQQQQQHQQQNLQHPGFGGANQAHNLNLFGGHNQTGFQSNAGGIGAGLGGGLGAAANIAEGRGGTRLDSHEARMGFAHGAQLQENAVRGHDGAKGIAGQRIRDVWRSNLQQEMDVLRSLVERYPYISMVRVLVH
jgi:CCR4-NOT transcription complex subunit 7/8